jgi:radical SAM protein with 4Fe4S-binding SPASM domain
MINRNDYVALSNSWILYSNNNSNVLYKLSLFDAKYFILSGIGGVTLSLLNGGIKYCNLIKIVHYLFSYPSIEAVEQYLTNLFIRLNKDEDIILFSKDIIKTTNSYNPEKFIVSKNIFVLPNRLKSPIRLLIYPTGNCTTNCIYCYADLENLRKFKDMSLEQWTKIFAEAKKLGIICVDITGGDLFARKDSVDFICKLIEYEFLFFLSTKSYISAKDAEKIVIAGFKNKVFGVEREFQLSIDHTYESITKLMVNADDYADRIEKTALNLIDVGIIPIIKSVITPFNFKNLEEMILRFKKLGIIEFNLAKYENSFYRHKDLYSLTVEQEIYVHEMIEKLASENEDIIITGNFVKNIKVSIENQNDLYKENNKEKLDSIQNSNILQRTIEEVTGCTAGRTTLGILPNGQACLCEKMRMIEPFVFGDLTTQSIVEVWNSKELKQICFPSRKMFTNTLCESCKDFEECVLTKGQCFRDNYFGRNPDLEKGNIYRQTSCCYKL